MTCASKKSLTVTDNNSVKSSDLCWNYTRSLAQRFCQSFWGDTLRWWSSNCIIPFSRGILFICLLNYSFVFSSEVSVRLFTILIDFTVGSCNTQTYLLTLKVSVFFSHFVLLMWSSTEMLTELFDPVSSGHSYRTRDQMIYCPLRTSEVSPALQI